MEIPGHISAEIDRSVLMRDASVIACRDHAVMCAKLFISTGQILTRVDIKIAESG